MNVRRHSIIAALFVLCSCTALSQLQEDPNLWLEDVNSERSLEWVQAQNSATTTVLEQHPEFWKLNKKILDILDSKERIAYPSIRGKYVYNFWQDEKNPYFENTEGGHGSGVTSSQRAYMMSIEAAYLLKMLL